MDILTYIQNRHFTYKVDEGTIFVSGLCFEELDDICSTKEFYGIDFYEPYDLREPGQPFDSGVQILLTADHPMYNYKSIDQQIDPATEKQPNEYDAVLSEQTSPLASAAVLGGIEGIKLRLENPDVTMKIAALYECSQYGEEGFDLLIQYLNNEYWQVQKAAYLILNSSLDYLIFNSSSKQKIKEILQQTNQQGFKIEQIKEVTVNEYGRTIYTGSQIVKYFIEDLGKGVTLEMAVIPGGTFMMGSPEYEQGRSSNENPQHLVTVPDFLIGKYPITQAQYKAIIGRRVSKFKGNDRPVDNVSWCDALEFCQVLSQITGKNYKLPSEAQWEYACRAGTGTPFYFGKTITTNLVNFYGEADYPYAFASKGEYRKQTTDVGSFPPNAFGLYDMHGNVWEWCEDVWRRNYDNAPTDGSAFLSRTRGDMKVIRGGSWRIIPHYCRSAKRSRCGKEFKDNELGFRVVLSEMP